MAVQPQYLAYVLEQLAGLPAVRPNRMFGGIGLYSDGLFFGLIDDDTLYFKTSDANIEAYRSRNMPKFMPFPDRTGAVMGYHQVPADIIEDAESLVEWARRSVAVALTAQAAKAAKPLKKKAARKPAKKPAAGKRTKTPSKTAGKKRPVSKPRPTKRVARKSARTPARKPAQKE
ncbi:MAG: competence protein TfoX [Steroidobacteraceae bacterium]|nr:competence protein TfoX [Steroidobacteraceae bacterium]